MGLIAVALVLPRLLALWGVPYAASLAYGDGPDHYLYTDQLTKAADLSEQRVARLQQLKVVPRSTALQPLGLYRVAGVWSRWLGPMSIWTTLLTNGLFTLILLAGLVGLGCTMGSLRLGLWAALLAALCPALVGASWYLGTDYPVAAMTVSGLFLLVRTRGLTHGPYCLLFVGWSALALCIKLTYALYMVVPCAAAVVVGLLAAGTPRARLRLLITALLVALVCGTLPLLLQGLSLSEVHRTLVAHAEPGHLQVENMLRPWSVQWLLAIPGFVAGSYPLPLLLLALPGLLLLHRRGARGYRWLLLGLIWGTTLLLTLLYHKLARYAFPLYPICCLLTAWWILRWIPRRWQTAVLGIVAALYASVLVVSHHKPTPWIWTDFTDMPMPSRQQLDALRRHGFHEACEVRPMIQAIKSVAQKQPASRVVWVGTVWDETFPPDPPPYVGVGIMLTQVLRDRLVGDLGNLSEESRIPSQLIVVHGPQHDPRRLDPALRLQQRVPLSVRCIHKQFAVRVSRYRKRP